MARGNWSPDRIKPRPRCRLCRYVVRKADMVRLDGVNPAHRDCAIVAGRAYTVELVKQVSDHQLSDGVMK